jgi:mono/diheme cytochrome c family protein
VKQFLSGIAVTLVLLVGVGLAVIYSGAYNIAADRPHNAVETWILGTAMTNSVKAHASGIKPPTDLNSESRVHDGLRLFDEMCVQCHGAPGKERDEVGKGLRPEPPDLTKAVRRWNAAELFWIVSHGITATGMPSFGGTHTDEQLWNIVAFITTLPELSPEQYKTQRQHDPDQDHPRSTRSSALKVRCHDEQHDGLVGTSRRGRSRQPPNEHAMM